MNEAISVSPWATGNTKQANGVGGKSGAPLTNKNAQSFHDFECVFVARVSTQ